MLRADPRAARVIAGLSAATAPCLLVGRTADEQWDGSLARLIPGGEVFEVPRADHLLEIMGDPLASIDVLRSVTAAVADFLHGLALRP
jgi:hypothetical protein